MPTALNLSSTLRLTESKPKFTIRFFQANKKLPATALPWQRRTDVFPLSAAMNVSASPSDLTSIAIRLGLFVRDRCFSL